MKKDNKLNKNTKMTNCLRCGRQIRDCGNLVCNECYVKLVYGEYNIPKEFKK